MSSKDDSKDVCVDGETVLQKTKKFNIGYKASAIQRKINTHDSECTSAIGEMLIAIQKIAIKYNLNSHTIIKILSELPEVFLKNSYLDSDIEWIT